MTGRVKVGVPHRLFYIGELIERWQLFDCSASTTEQCRLCGQTIRSTNMGGNALAQVGHLRKHIRDGHLERVETKDGTEYRVTIYAPVAWRGTDA